ncbi:MAG TPA: T9SS type A sorting domain-containing protein [Candidatus Kapabacteria bacterium]
MKNLIYVLIVVSLAIASDGLAQHNDIVWLKPGTMGVRAVSGDSKYYLGGVVFSSPNTGYHQTLFCTQFDANKPLWMKSFPDRVDAASFSNDNTKVCYFARYGVHIVDAATGVEEQYLSSGDQFTDLTMSSDNKLLAGTASGIVIFDVAAKKVLYRISAPSHSVHSVAFSADNKYLSCSFAHDSTVQIFDVALGKVVHSFPIQSPYKIKFSPDGKWLLTAGVNKRVSVWNIEAGTLYREIRDTGYINSFAISSDSKLVVYSAEGSYDTTSVNSKLYNFLTGELLQEYVYDGCSGGSIGFMSSGIAADDIVYYSACNRFNLYETNTGKFIKEVVHGHQGDLGVIALSPDQKTLATGSGALDQELSFWNPESGQLKYRMMTSTGPFNKIQYSKSQDYLWISIGTIPEYLITLNRLNIADRKEDNIDEFMDYKFGNRTFDIFNSSGNIISGDGGGKKLLIRDSVGKRLDTVAFTSHQITSISVSKDDQYVLAGNEGGYFGLWKLPFLTPVILYQYEKTPIGAIAISPNSTLLAVSIRDSVHIWDIQSEAPIITFRANDRFNSTRMLAFTKDSRYLVVGGAANQITIRSSKTGDSIYTFEHIDNIYSMVLSDNSERLFAGGEDGSLICWDIGYVLTNIGVKQSKSTSIDAGIALHYYRDANKVGIKMAERYSETCTIELYNINAQKVISLLVDTQISDNESLVDVSSLPKGVYLVSVKADGRQTRSKLLLY